MSRISRTDDARRFDKDRTRQDILTAAREEFATHGLAGGRVEAIASRTKTVKRMIYYYFGSKEGLYIAVLEDVYASIRSAETQLDLLDLEPAEAVRRLVAFTFDYQDAHPDFIRLVTIENIHRGEHMAKSELIRGLNSTVVEMLDTILARGRTIGLFRPDVDAIDTHMLISSFCFFRMSNRHTFGLLFGRDLADPAHRDHHKDLIADAVLRSLELREISGAGARPAATKRPARDRAAI